MSVSRTRIANKVATEPSLYFKFVNDEQTDEVRLTTQADVPLTPRQKLMWLDEELHPDIPVNTWITRFEIGTDIDAQVLCEAFFTVIARHDAWRMTVIRTDDGYKGKLLEDLPDCFEYVDFSAASDPQAEYEQWHLEKATMTFPLGTPLFYAAIVTLENSRRVFYLVQHHGTKDGTCDNVLIAELDEAYRSIKATDTLPDFEPAFSFADHMRSQDKLRGTPQWEERQKFWDDRYATPPEPCELYGAVTESKHPKVHRVYAEVDPAVVNKIRKFLPNSAIFNVAAFAFLRTITRNDDICVGVALHNRTKASANGVGLFMEIVPNRLQIDAQDSFNSVFRKLASEFARTTRNPKQAVTHPNARYEVVINYRQPVDWTFVGESVSVEQMPALAVQNPQFDKIETGHEWSMLESLSIDVVHKPGTDKALIAFDFNSGVWSQPQTRDRAVELYLRMLEAYVSDPDQIIDEIGEFATPDSEDAVFLQQMSAVEQASDPQPLVAAWRSQLESIGSKPALHCGERTVSHDELDELAGQIAGGLAAQGVHSGDRVITIAQTSIEQTAAFIAVASLGAVYVPVDPSSPPTRIEKIAKSMRPRLILHDQAGSASLPRSLKVPVISLDDKSLYSADVHAGVRVAPEEAAYVIHTSGSTGAQKAVVVSHGALSSFAEDWAKTLRFSSDDTVLHFYSIAFDSWLTGIVPVLKRGASQVIPQFEDVPLGSELLKLVSDHGVTVADVPTSYLQSITMELREGTPHPDAPFRCWTFGGSALSLDIANAAVSLIPKNVRLINSYGPSEATVSVCVADLRDCELEGRRQLPIGRPNETVGMRIVNAVGSPVPFGVSGELWVSGPQLANEYWEAPDVTDERFVTNEDGRWYRTGDLVRWGTDYRLEYLGRNDRQVQIRGHRVEPGEIESAIRGNEDIADVYVGTIGGVGQEQLAGYCVPKPGRALDADALRSELTVRLPAYMVPQTLVELEAIPLNTSGKVDVHALPTIELNRDVGDITPRTELERMIQEIWWKSFDIWPIGLEQNFLDLGGHSLLAIEICSKIETCTGKRITPAELFANPTVRAIAEHLQSDNDRDYSVVSLNSCTYGTPIFCLCGIFMYQPLAKALEDDCPVFGVYAREEASFFGGKDGDSSVREPLRKLADQYVEAIREKQPQGPYRLTGISFGGILAYEVAQRLSRSGEEVEIVGLIDTMLQTAIKRRWMRWIALRMCDYLERAMAAALALVSGKFSAGEQDARLKTFTGGDDDRFTEALERVARTYRPEPFQGRLLLFAAADRENIPGCKIDPRLGWDDVAEGGLTICTVRGTHLSVLSEENVADVAAAFRAQIELNSE